MSKNSLADAMARARELERRHGTRAEREARLKTLPDGPERDLLQYVDDEIARLRPKLAAYREQQLRRADAKASASRPKCRA